MSVDTAPQKNTKIASPNIFTQKKFNIVFFVKHKTKKL